MHKHIDKAAVSKAIIEGTKYIIDCQQEDGGLKFENENSNISGVWTTAEALEFLLTSKLVPITAFNKINHMIDFILDTQRADGSWPVLKGEADSGPHQKSSTISTGHCIYILRLALIGNYLESSEEERVENAIKKGRNWIKKCKKDKDGYSFWPSEYSSEILNPNVNQVTRMDYIFSTFYAMMAYLPVKGLNRTTEERTILTKVNNFFTSQAQWFCEKYKNEFSKDLDDATISKTASTICRISSALYLLQNGNLSNEKMKNLLINSVSVCGRNPFVATGIDVNTQSPSFSVKEYNNNTPFDYGMALLWLETDIDSLETVIDTYIKKQEMDGSWYLNFSSAFSRKIWTTSEALLVLEKALDKYDEIAYKSDLEDAQKTISKMQSEISDLKAKNSDLSKTIEHSKTQIEYEKVVRENNSLKTKISTSNETINSLKESKKSMASFAKQLRKDWVISTLVMLVLAIIIIVYTALWAANPNNSNSAAASIATGIILPTVLAVLYDVFKLIMTILKKGISEDE